jgi:hypothetical protein
MYNHICSRPRRTMPHTMHKLTLECISVALFNGDVLAVLIRYSMYVCMYVCIHTIQFSLQLRKFLVDPQLSPWFHVNSRTSFDHIRSSSDLYDDLRNCYTSPYGLQYTIIQYNNLWKLLWSLYVTETCRWINVKAWTKWIFYWKLWSCTEDHVLYIYIVKIRLKSLSHVLVYDELHKTYFWWICDTIKVTVVQRHTKVTILTMRR